MSCYLALVDDEFIYIVDVNKICCVLLCNPSGQGRVLGYESHPSSLLTGFSRGHTNWGGGGGGKHPQLSVLPSVYFGKGKTGNSIT